MKTEPILLRLSTDLIKKFDIKAKELGVSRPELMKVKLAEIIKQEKGDLK